MKQSLPSSKPLIELVAGSAPDAPPVAAELAFLVDVEKRWNWRLSGPVIGTFDALAQGVGGAAGRSGLASAAHSLLL
jgi:hypothetical protein